MNTIFTKPVLAGLLVFVPALMLSAPASAAQLDDYISEALHSNLALKQAQFELEQSLASLAEARGMFLPSVDLESRYTRAGGGREIEIPIGDLINPVHQSLNQLLGENRFPGNLPNEVTPFLREEEQETKIRLTQPLFQPATWYNYRIQSNLYYAERAARDRFARSLVADVKSAYYGYLSAVRVAELYDSTALLLEENLRISQLLVDNDKATQDVVLRSRAELSELRQQQAEAGRDVELARSYFNFLLNRPLDEAVGDSESPAALADPFATADLVREQALANREELEQLRFSEAAASSSVRLAGTRFLPGVSLALDYGFQGEEYRFTEDDDYWMASVVFRWNLFNGFQDKAKLTRARLEREKTRARFEQARQQIQLEARDSWFSLDVARRSLEAAEDRAASAEKSFDIVQARFREGMAAQIEFLDARTTLTRAQLNRIITNYHYAIRIAEAERVAASYPLPGWIADEDTSR